MKNQFKKSSFVLLISIFFIFPFFSQNNICVDIDDGVYAVLENASLRGFCEPLPAVKPYSQKFIKEKLEEILSNLESSSESYEFSVQKSVVENELLRLQHTNGLELAKATFRVEGNVLDFPLSLEVSDSINSFFSYGFYDYKDYSRGAMEVLNVLDFSGDLGANISYRNKTYLGLSKVPLAKAGVYDIGYWYSTKYNSTNDFSLATEQDSRTINVYKNPACLPYSYQKNWDGSAYPIEGGINAGGLHPWPYDLSLVFGMSGEIRGGFLNDVIELGIGRERREWGAMDLGSSLALNSSAQPFFAFDTALKPFKWISLRTMTGILEMPNRSDVLANAFYPVDENGKKINTEPGNTDNLNSDEYKDYHYFQNAFSIGELDLDFKYLHFDFGSTCVWPKRFELAYAFPLIDRIVYQNDVGDYDNLALYADLKIRYPGVGFIWGSFFLDELNAFFTKFWETTRAMYAYQVGLKVAVPKLPFATFSLRYTKIEPYCYTHQAINGTPWYNGYISENYTNNGQSLGYYLQPNSKELLARLEMNPFGTCSAALQYQFIIHGADFGSKAVPGSNIFSELPRNGRGELKKHFLRDGAYEWTHVIALSGSYKFSAVKVPVTLNASVGYVYDFFTSIDGSSVSIYESDNRYSVKESYHRVENEEYFTTNGLILSLGIKIFGR